MKTIVVIANIPDSVWQFRSDVVKTMVQKGHKVYVCASASNRMADAMDRDPVARLEALGAEFIDVKIDRTGLSPVNDLKLLVDFYRLFKKLKPDAVFMSTPKPVIYGSVAARRAGVPMVCSLVNGLAFGLRDEKDRKRIIGRLIQALYRWGLGHASITLFQNPDDRQLFWDLKILKPSQKTHIINGSGVDIDQYPQVPLPAGKAVFLLIARLLWYKGISDYFEAAKIVKAKGYDAKWLLVGHLEAHPDAVDEESLKKMQSESPVEYLGPLSDVRPTMGESNVYVILSSAEGQSRAVLEAMSMGRPVITTDAPGCRETVVPNVNGLFVPIKDPEATAAAMIKLIENPDLRTSMGAESRRMAVEKYAVPLVTAEILRSMEINE